MTTSLSLLNGNNPRGVAIQTPGSAPKNPEGVSKAGTIPDPILHYNFITFKGFGPNRKDGFSVMCGDTPPTITGGYAKWATVDRPLMRGVTVFQGYDPVKMSLSLRFGVWNGSGWHIDNDQTGAYIEQQIEKLEWMAGSNFASGQSPFVYVNTYGPRGGSTNLIPYEYQNTAGVSGSLSDANQWPWIIGDQIQWGQSWRAAPGAWAGAGNRVYQECTVVLTNFQGLTKPPTKQASGSYYVTSKARNTVLLIAGDPKLHALDVQSLATAIQGAHQNNPIPGTRIHLSAHSLRWIIPAGRSVFVPGHLI